MFLILSLLCFVAAFVLFIMGIMEDPQICWPNNPSFPNYHMWWEHAGLLTYIAGGSVCLHAIIITVFHINGFTFFYGLF